MKSIFSVYVFIFVSSLLTQKKIIKSIISEKILVSEVNLKVRSKAHFFHAIFFEKASCCFRFIRSLLDDRDNVISKKPIILDFFLHHFFFHQTCVNAIFSFLPTKRQISLFPTQIRLTVKVLGSVKMMTELSSFGKHFLVWLIGKHEHRLSM